MFIVQATLGFSFFQESLVQAWCLLPLNKGELMTGGNSHISVPIHKHWWQPLLIEKNMDTAMFIENELA